MNQNSCYIIHPDRQQSGRYMMCCPQKKGAGGLTGLSLRSLTLDVSNHSHPHQLFGAGWNLSGPVS